MVKLTKEIKNRISKNEYYTEADFIEDCKTYIKAVKSGRILYDVTHVSNSGMSRDINIRSFEGKMANGHYRTYTSMLETLGYKFNNDWSIKVSGCGMNMLFATNYDIIHAFKRIGLIKSKTCNILAQKVN